jgi:hypothetical protein
MLELFRTGAASHRIVRGHEAFPETLAELGLRGGSESAALVRGRRDEDELVVPLIERFGRVLPQVFGADGADRRPTSSTSRTDTASGWDLDWPTCCCG